MTDACLDHQTAVSALADGELDLAPEASLAHIVRCRRCLGELTAHQLLSARIAEAVSSEARGQRRTRRRAPLRLVVAAAGVAVVAAGLGTWGVSHGRADEISTAVAAAADRATFVSSDPAEISAWCSRMSDRAGPEVAISEMSPTGARSDRAGEQTIVTVFYRTSRERPEQVTVGWTSAHPNPPDRQSIQERQVDGRTVLIVQAPLGTAVVGGDAGMGALWRVAGELASTPRSGAAGNGSAAGGVPSGVAEASA